MSIGIDEVGRGCWAGPLLVVAARQKSDLPAGLKDSKKLTKIQREGLLAGIVASCDIGEGWVLPGEIDKYGLTESMRLGVERALAGLEAGNDEKIVVDGNINYCSNIFYKASAVIGADILFPIVSAASIYAKVTRDKFMTELPDRYNKYGFSAHVGYGTPNHLASIKLHGISDIHRRSFKPIMKFL
jgi:ribonuclease HII